MKQSVLHVAIKNGSENISMEMNRLELPENH